MLKPLDFVRTPSGAIALVTCTTGGGKEASIAHVGPHNGEKCAWWKAAELTVIDSLPLLLAHATKGSASGAHEDVERAFGCATNELGEV